MECDDFSDSCRAAFGVRVSLSSSKREQLLTDIISVLLGFKPALLVDCAQTTAHKFQALLSEIIIKNQPPLLPILETEDFVRNLCIVEINGDVLLVNLTAQESLWDTVSVVRSKRDEVEYCPCYVNIEQGLSTPYIVQPSDSKYDFIEGTFTKLYHNLKLAAQKSYTKDVTTDDLRMEASSTEHKSTLASHTTVPVVEGVDSLIANFNVCTLFGRLLGYPSIYWFNPDKGYTLDMVPLTRYTIKTRKRKYSTPQPDLDLFQQERVLYSFTVPVSLLSAVEGVIARWIERVGSIAGNHALELNVQTETLCLPFVAL